MRVCLAVCELVGLALTLSAQNPKLQFEVASVRAFGPQTGAGRVTGGPGTDDPERITYYRMPIAALLTAAYGVGQDRIFAPDWAVPQGRGASDRFDINAKVPPGTTKAQATEMLRNLLEERLQLSVHHATKEYSGYALTVAKGGSKLKESAGPPAESERSVANGGAIRQEPGKDGHPLLFPGLNMGGAYVDEAALDWFRDYPLPEFANRLSAILGVPVVDKTGLMARYDFSLQLTFPEFALPAVLALMAQPPGQPILSKDGPLPAQLDAFPTVSSAVEKQLGLKLEPAKVPMDTLVIDHIERKPTEN